MKLKKFKLMKYNFCLLVHVMIQKKSLRLHGVYIISRMVRMIVPIILFSYLHATRNTVHIYSNFS